MGAKKEGRKGTDKPKRGIREHNDEHTKRNHRQDTPTVDYTPKTGNTHAAITAYCDDWWKLFDSTLSREVWRTEDGVELVKELHEKYKGSDEMMLCIVASCVPTYLPLALAGVKPGTRIPQWAVNKSTFESGIKNEEVKKSVEHLYDFLREIQSSLPAPDVPEVSRSDNVEDFRNCVIGKYAFLGGKEPSVGLSVHVEQNKAGEQLVVSLDGIDAGHPKYSETLELGTFIKAVWTKNEKFVSKMSGDRAETQNFLHSFVRELIGGPMEIPVSKTETLESTKKELVGFTNEFQLTFEKETEYGTTGYLNFDVGVKKVSITLFKSKKYVGPEWGFVVKLATAGSLILFQVKSDADGVYNLVHSEEDGFVVVLHNKESVVEVISINAECSKAPVMVGDEIEWVGGLQISDRLELKKKIAEAFNLTPKWDTEERSFIFAIDEHDKQVVAGENEAARRKRIEEKAVADELLRNEVMARATVTVYKETGEEFVGIPVNKNEWRVIKQDRTNIVIVDENNKPSKGSVVFYHMNETHAKAHFVVYTENPLKEKAVKAIGKQFISLPAKKIHQPVMVFASGEDVKRLQEESGLNSGTPVAYPQAGSEGKILSVVKVFHDHIESVGEVKVTETTS